MNVASPLIAVVTDSISDIPSNEVAALQITVIPALLTIDGTTFKDGIDITRDQFYLQLPYASSPPTTAVPSILAFEEAYQKLLNSGIDRVLSIHLTPKLSGIFDVASKAAQAFGDKVFVFDSRHVSLGLGFQVMEAAAAVLDGLPFETILEITRNARDKVRLIAMIDTQEYLKRSGRVSWVQANLGKMLRLRLLVQVTDGVVERLGLSRTRRKAIDELILKVQSWGPLKRFAILHSAAEEEAVSLAEGLRHLASLPPLVVDVTTLLGAHIGPGSIGFAGLQI